MFVIEPFDFEHEYSQALLKRLHGRIEVRVVSVGTLIRMKGGRWSASSLRSKRWPSCSTSGGVHRIRNPGRHESARGKGQAPM
jgi:hypothetical protein